MRDSLVAVAAWRASAGCHADSPLRWTCKSTGELAAVPLRRHDWHGEWNYTVLPTTAWANKKSAWSGEECWVGAPVVS